MTRTTIAVLLLLLVATLAFPQDKPREFHFSKHSLGKLPPGWKADRTGPGEGSVWQVVADDAAPSGSGHALAQVAEGPNPLYNLCVVEGARHADVELRVAFKAVKGKLDQGGGFVWRYRDADNYYVARMNPLEKNYRFYKVVAGKRTQLATKEGLAVPVGEWHTLKIRHVGDKIACYLDDKVQLEAKDDTFTGAGQVGLWTKADAQTRFDGFVVAEPGK